MLLAVRRLRRVYGERIFPVRSKEFAMNIGLLFILPLTYAFFVYVSKHVCLHIAAFSQTKLKLQIIVF